MRNSFATAVPVTAEPLPREVREYIHDRIRDGATIGRVEWEEYDLARVSYVYPEQHNELVDVTSSPVSVGYWPSAVAR